MPIDVTNIARDAAYVTVGAGVLTFQKAQVGRRRARARLDARLAEAREHLGTAREQVRSRLHATVSDTAA